MIVSPHGLHVLIVSVTLGFITGISDGCVAFVDVKQPLSALAGSSQIAVEIQAKD